MADTTVFIADDHPFIRDGVKSALSKGGGFEVVGEAQDGAHALDEILKLKPDMVVMDVTMPRLNGIDATRRILETLPDTNVIILSMHDDVFTAMNAFRAGAKAYVMKDDPSEELLKAVEKVRSGSKYASPAVAEDLFSDLVEVMKRDQSADPFDTLTEREREILRHIAEGETSRQIAEKLCISLATVKSHRNNLMKKLKCNDMAGLIKIAIKKGLVMAD